MAQDRVFDALLTVNPHEALLQQGFMWTISHLFRVPANGTLNLSWQVPDVFSHLHFTFTCDKDVEQELFFVNSFSGGEIIKPFNRNSRFARTASPPATVFRSNIVFEDVNTPVAQGLFIGGARVSFPPLIVNSLHQAAVFINTDKKAVARVWPIVIFHEQPIQDIPAGDPGPP